MLLFFTLQAHQLLSCLTVTAYIQLCLHACLLLVSTLRIWRQTFENFECLFLLIQLFINYYFLLEKICLWLFACVQLFLCSYFQFLYFYTFFLFVSRTLPISCRQFFIPKTNKYFFFKLFVFCFLCSVFYLHYYLK